MATILKGKYKGKECKLHQWCNDWFSVKCEGKPLILSPTNLQLTGSEMYDVINCKSNGILFNLFEPTPDLKFKKKKL